MNQYLVILFLFLISCDGSLKQTHDHQKEYEALKNENSALKNQISELNYLKDKSEAVIPGTELKQIKSKINNQQYFIKIKLPKGYDNSHDRYPVLYVIDAETNFGGVSYIVQRLIKDNLIPPILVVGIAYGTDYNSFYKLRSRDLTPVEDKSLTFGTSSDIHPTGGADKFCDFLAEELFPFIDDEYRTVIKERSIYGHSYGGLFGTYVLLNKPELFNKFLILSPSLWYYNEMMIDHARELRPSYDDAVLYMASGELEGRIDRLQNDFVAILKERNLDNVSLKAEILENETHRTIFGAGFTNGLRFIYSKNN